MTRMETPHTWPLKKLRRSGSGWIACCPAHDDTTPSLSIGLATDGKVLVHCHAGCSQQTVIDALRQLGCWPGNTPTKRTDGIQATYATVRDTSHRSLTALAIWKETVPATGTLVETYLQSRGLNVCIPEALRFHPDLHHASGRRWPAMVALVTRATDGKPQAVHRTFLAPDGSGKAPVAQPRMMLGPCRGGVVRLSNAGGELMIGEGIETCLAAMQATGRPAWASLSASSLACLPLPEQIESITILADGDPAGERASMRLARRLAMRGRKILTATPPSGLDFNDVLLGRQPALEKS
ncbi:MAG: toprim domain-containing protein [Alphaproteobacteria bacterium]